MDARWTEEIDCSMGEKISVNKTNRLLLRDLRDDQLEKRARMGEFRQNNASIKKFNLYSMNQDQKEAQVPRFGLKIGWVPRWDRYGQVATDWRPKNRASAPFEDKIAAEGQTCNNSPLNPNSTVGERHRRNPSKEIL